MKMNELNKIFSKILGLNEDAINEDISKENTEEWDSFNHLLLISEVEKTFGITFSILEIENIKDYKTLKNLIDKKEVKSVKP
jgi:acyl carrier protein